MKSYRDLIVWQKSFALAKTVYHLTAQFPAVETCGLSSQLRRAAVSIVSNIAEGFSRQSPRETKQFFGIAFGSTSEVGTRLLLARELGYANPTSFTSAEFLLVEIRKMLRVMLVGLRRKSRITAKF